MKMKLLGALLALGMVGAGAAPAQAGETMVLPGCWGAVVTVCDVTVSAAGVEVTEEEEPICAGTCTTITVPAAEITNFNDWTCVRYGEYGYGGRHYVCTWAEGSKVCFNQDAVWGGVVSDYACLPE